MNVESTKELITSSLPALEDFLKTILLKKFGASVVSADLGSYKDLSGLLKEKGVIIGAKDKGYNSEIVVAFDDQWIPQLSSAMLGVEENEINEITADLIKEFSTQLLSTTQITLAEQDINIKPEEVDLIKPATIDQSLNSEQYFITEIKVEGKFEIEGDEKPSLSLWFAFSPVDMGASSSADIDEEDFNIDDLVIGAEETEGVKAQSVQFDSFKPGVMKMSQEEVRNLELLRDVKIDISVELGRKELPLGDILHMVRGSVIELEKLAGEPVDVFANGRLIATGEVVVIDEHFGVRVTQLVSARERLESVSSK
jgi:flagellar motor switch protein FliN/FliY